MTNRELIPFNVPAVAGSELKYVSRAIEARRLCGDGYYSRECQLLLEDKFKAQKVLLTPSCTAALEMAAMLIGVKEGDEVIMPSYTFVSTANAFVLRGAKIVFVDIRPDTLNIDEGKIEEAITSKTKAIVPVHYAGVACEMEAIMEIADRYNLFVIEDAAQGVMSSYKGKALGSIGHLGCYSFHETKNYTAGGEGGALLVNDVRFIERSEIIREKGTNRARFMSGMIDKYTWQDLGSSFLPSELQAAYLFAQLLEAEKINECRLGIWKRYNSSLSNDFQVAKEPSYCFEHNAHMFYLILGSKLEREKFIRYMKLSGISTPFHYVPLHSSPYGNIVGKFSGEDEYTTSLSQRLVRLPIWYGMPLQAIDKVINAAIEYKKS